MTQPSQHPTSAAGCTRRTALKQCAAGLAAVAVAPGMLAKPVAAAEKKLSSRPWVKIRGIYGGMPQAILDAGKTVEDFGLNAAWIGSGGLNQDHIKKFRDLGLKIYAEYNSMHLASFLKDHPDAAPIGSDGKPSPPPEGWVGVSPFHAGYRKNRMDEFRRVLETFEIDGIWLDYHHAQANWERPEPVMPDTDFSPVALKQFQEKTGLKLPSDTPAAAKLLLGEYKEQWSQFRCDVYTDWVREYREILNEVRPNALLGTFHCPWTEEERDGAIRHKLSIDLKAQAKYLDIFSIMPYHVRFGYANDIPWVGRQIKSLGKLLGIKGEPGEKKQIWPIVQLANWGDHNITPEEVGKVIDQGTQKPATGVMTFHWSGISREWDKAEALGKAYREISAQ